jgi:hypothetical protein
MKVPGNWNDLVEKCRAQDEELRRRLVAGPDSESWYDVISANLGFYDRLAKGRKRSGDGSI